MGYFNDMLQLPGLLLNFCCQEQRSLRNDLERENPQSVFIVGTTSNYGISQHCSGNVTYISMEFAEGVNHIKPVHIYYSSVDNQLRAGILLRHNTWMIYSTALE